MEQEIISAEARVAELERLLASAGVFADPEKSTVLVAEYTELSGRLSELNARWEELGTRLQDAGSSVPAG